MLWQQIINGLSMGAIYALMAVGYSLIYSLMNFTNFAHGIVVTAGAYVGYYVLTYFSSSITVAIGVALVFGLLLSVIIEITTYRPLLLKNARRLFLIIAGLGLSIIAENLIIITLSGRFKAFPNELLKLGSIEVFGLSIGIIDMIVLGISIATLVFVELYVQHTRDGLAIRAASFSLETASIMGINTDLLMIKVFAIAGVLASLAGFFLGMKYTAYPQLGSTLTNKAFISAVLGGLGSLSGAVIGAFILGVMEVLVAGYISSGMRDIFAFALLVIILLIKPTGLMGKSSEDKA